MTGEICYHMISAISIVFRNGEFNRILLFPHGGNRNLKSLQIVHRVAQLVYHVIEPSPPRVTRMCFSTNISISR